MNESTTYLFGQRMLRGLEPRHPGNYYTFENGFIHSFGERVRTQVGHVTDRILYSLFTLSTSLASSRHDYFRISCLARATGNDVAIFIRIFAASRRLDFCKNLFSSLRVCLINKSTHTDARAPSTHTFVSQSIIYCCSTLCSFRDVTAHLEN